MSQSATQRTTGATRFKGPTIITLRGAGSKGKEYTLGGVAPVGTGLDVGLSVQIPTGQSANAFQVEQPDGTVIAQIDANGNFAQSGVLGAVQAVKQVTLTAANLIAMYTTPVAIVPAPGAGVALVVSQILFQLKATSTAFSGGGIVVFQYDTTAHGAGTLVHAGSIPATVVNAGSAGSTVTGLWAASGSNGLTVPANKGIYISNQTGVFAAGTGTAIVTISYDILTLS